MTEAFDISNNKIIISNIKLKLKQMLNKKLVTFKKDFWTHQKLLSKYNKRLVESAMLDYALDLIKLDEFVNAPKIAILLGHIDSRRLDRITRQKIGLPEKFTPYNNFSQVKTQTLEDKERKWTYNCNSSEKHLIDVLYNPNPEQESTYKIMIIYDTLSIESQDMVMGYSSNLKEFINGAIIYPNTWYHIREVEEKVKIQEIKSNTHINEQKETKEIKFNRIDQAILYDPEYICLVPTRGLNPKGDSLGNYSSYMINYS